MNLRDRPKLGQNFLISPTAQTAIADALGDISQRTVVEIGPGRGAITHILARRARRLIAIELDPALAAQLQADFSDQPNVTILRQNILATDLAALAREAHAEPEARGDSERFSPLLIVGNLPYYITSDILLHLFAAHRAIERAVVMIQREVADRVAAQPSSRDYGLLSVTAQLYAQVEKLFTLPPGAFSPPPQVHSSVLRLTMQPRFEELGIDPEAFTGFMRGCFAQKRKTLTNNLRAAGHEPDAIAAAFTACDVAPQVRAEQLDPEALARLYCRFRDH
ncbi:MAG TPA: 16S rRNA (adenine(1518)-N(6)/adenine(1519)-N(6))-dimethyltransferase RsmA [Acidobacteriaceae bacterium]|nr:16S rRNA (adenine(1518)-N(6)/adenine(1519)-N(6))-dimethyltransferase RsmA [Acidobacteriaceae bacterium]